MHSVTIQLLRAALGTLRPVVDACARGDLRFPDLACRWLVELEEAMSRLRLSEGARLSALRARILTAGADRERRQEARRAQRAAASEALAEAEALARSRIDASVAALEPFHARLQEAATAACIAGVLPCVAPDGDLTEPWLRGCWQRLVDHPPTRPTVTWMASALRATDRLHLLGEVMLGLTDTSLPVRPAAPR